MNLENNSVGKQVSDMKVLVELCYSDEYSERIEEFFPKKIRERGL